MAPSCSFCIRKETAIMITVRNSLPICELLLLVRKMKYTIQFKPRAIKDIESLTSKLQLRIIKNIEDMSNNLKGDVKHLTDSTPEFRLRVGNYRVLFEIEGKAIVIYRVRHRREAYR